MANPAINSMIGTIKSSIVQRVKIEANKNKAQSGVVRGGSVVVGNKSYAATPVVDFYYTDGDTVWVIPDESSGRAIIVGN
jgi:hypothetical protein